MPMRQLFSFSISLISSGNSQHSPEEIQRLAFGSCNNPRKKKPSMFPVIEKSRPDLFLLLGDNIYGDTYNMKLLEKKYRELGSDPHFKSLREKVPIQATWDGHDYGVNDGGKSYKKRQESGKIFLDFFGVADDSPRRKRQGVYSAATFGPEGRRL